MFTETSPALSQSSIIADLIDALQCLPGIGQKNAQRIAYHLLEHNREGAINISQALQNACKHIKNCQRCHNFSEHDICTICSDPRRDQTTLCIVESPIDLVSIEQTNIFKGRYFVLMGKLSPLDGIGPKELRLDHLETILKEGEIKEVILATNLTIEGEATAHYIGELVQDHGILATKLAHGIPVGGELEYVNHVTLSRAFEARRPN